MKSIQKISEQLVLTLYLIQRKKGYITEEVLNFTPFGGEMMASVHSQGFSLEVEDEEFEKALQKISGGSDVDLLNAFKYLKGKNLLNYDSSGTSNSDYEIYNIELTSGGIDIIEGVAGAETKKKDYQVTFNVKLADNINLESLFKAELGSILKLI